MTQARLPQTFGRVALLLAVAALAWLAMRAYAQRLLSDGAPEAAAVFAPADGTSLANLALARITAQGGRVDALSRSLYRSALERDPLSAMVLALAGLDANAAGDPPLARRRMEAARHRDPRLALARIWLFNDYMQSRALDRALDEVQPIARLRSGAYAQIREVLKALVLTPEGRAALQRKLAQNPDWRIDLLSSAMADPAAQQSGLALFLTLPSNPDRARADAEASIVLDTLVTRGDGALAYGTWLQLLPRSFATRAGAPYDGSFEGWPGPPPFNWTLVTNENGTAQVVRDARLPHGMGLAVNFFGAVPTELAWQYVRLSPGAYHLTGVVRRDGGGETSGQMDMGVSCGATRTGAISLAAATAEPQRFSMPFAIAPDCALARVQIVGSPGDALGTINVQVTSLAVTR